VPRFEEAVAEYCGATYGVALNSATSALHAACVALGVGPGDRVWTTPNTFVATANCALLCGAKVDFVDIDSKTYNLSVDALQSKLHEAELVGKLPKVVIPVHFAGQSCDMAGIFELSKEYGFRIIEDASHAIGAEYQNQLVGSCRYSDITVFSFHPVKIITSGEGGIAICNQEFLQDAMRQFKGHGIISQTELFSSRPTEEIWRYQQTSLGVNYRMSDIHAALGLSQLKRIGQFLSRRRQMADQYNSALESFPLTLPWQHPDSLSSFHLYPVRIRSRETGVSQREAFQEMSAASINVNLHYIPVYRHPYFEALGFAPGYCPEAESYFREIMTLPMFPELSERNQETVIESLTRILRP